MIDLKKVFDNYYKTKQADGQLRERANDSDKVLKGMRDDFQKAGEEYRKLVPPSLAKFGGKFIVRGGTFDLMEGNARERNVVIEFKDRATASACYQSPEYRAAKVIRQQYADADLIIIDGPPD